MSAMGNLCGSGLVLVDKPAGCTSHDVVNRWRRLAGTKRVGHLGTLDPMATGLLALVTGTATRLAQFFGHETKTYLAEVEFGKISDTYDVEGEITSTGMPAPQNIAEIAAALALFRGKFVQVPPAVSAKKVAGVPAYKLARKQIPVELKPVEVEVSQLDIASYIPGKVAFAVTCSAGFYVRSLAHDLGQTLGCGAVLSALRRTRIGALRVEDAYTLDTLAGMAGDATLASAVRRSAFLLPEFPSVHVEELTELHIRQGRQFRTSPFVVPPGSPRVKALSRDGELIAIGDLVIPNIYHPGVVL
jgi:tRNA pseudouridine55 synthase